MVCGSGVGNRKINCQCNVVTGFPWGYALSLIHVHFGNFPCMKESRVLPHFKCGKTHLEVRAEHILRNLVLAWKRWEPICRDDLIFYSRNIKRNQLTCFFYHFFPSKRKKSMSRSSMKMMIKLPTLAEQSKSYIWKVSLETTASLKWNVRKSTFLCIEYLNRWSTDHWLRNSLRFCISYGPISQVIYFLFILPKPFVDRAQESYCWKYFFTNSCMRTLSIENDFLCLVQYLDYIFEYKHADTTI